MDDDLGVLPEADVLIEGRRIIAVGARLTAAEAEVIDGTNRILMPGFVDTHRHMADTILRGFASTSIDGSFWREYFTIYGGNHSPEEVYASVRLATVEAIDGGITTIHAWEHNLLTPAHADAALRALWESGLRGRFSYGPRNEPQTIDRADVLRLRDQHFSRRSGNWWQTADERLQLGIACRWMNPLPEEIFQNEFAFARENGLPITVHATGEDIATYRRHQALGPDVLLVHAHHSTPEDIAYLADSGATFSASIHGLARMAIGRPPIVESLRAGIVTGLSLDTGMDGADFFQLMRTSLTVERVTFEDIEAYQPKDVLRQATIEGACCLGLAEVTGSISPGKFADLVMLRADDLHMAPLNVPEAQVVFNAQPRHVDSVWIDGVARKRNGTLVGVDVGQVLADARTAVASLTERTRTPIR
jgi:cytosine/adenosine deaminase-related metal-dependent hydrolase